MPCCLLCFDDSPLPDDPKASRGNTFQLSMMDTLTKNQPSCCVAYFCAPCCAYYTRYRVLEGDMRKYICCQGYMNCMCCIAGNLGEASCPEFCLCLESLFCLGPSVSSSRMYVMDLYDLRADPCDNRLIRFNNCLQMLACICDILSIFVAELRDLAQLIDFIARVVFYCMIGCMVSQVNYEVDYRKQNPTAIETGSPMIPTGIAVPIKG